MPTTTNIVEFIARGQDNVKRAYETVGNAAVKTGDKIKASSVHTAEVGKKAEIAADGFKDFTESMARGEGVAQALTSTIAPLASGLFSLGTTLGVGLAAAIPFVIMGLVSLIDEGETLTERTDKLTSATNAYAEAINNTKIPLSELTAQYGAQAEAMKTVFETQRAIEYANYTNMLKEQSAALIELIGHYLAYKNSTADVYADAKAQKAQADAIRAIGKEYGLTAEGAQRLFDLIVKLNEARGDEEKTVAVQGEIRDHLNEQEKLYGRLNEKANELRESTNSAVEGQIKLNVAVDDGVGKAGSLASAVWDVEAAARGAAAAFGSFLAGLDSKLAAAQAKARALREGVSSDEITAKMGANAAMAGGVDPGFAHALRNKGVETAREIARYEAEAKALEEAARKAALASSGGGGGSSRPSGGGGGGGSAIKKTSDEAQDLSKNIERAKITTKTWWEEMQAGAEDTRNTWVSAFDGMGDAVAEFVKTGKFDINSLFASIAEGFIDLAMKQMMYGTQGGFGGILGAIMGGMTGSLGGTATLGGQASPSAIANAMSGAGGMYYSGGVINRPTKFFANGGLASAAEKGAEAIMPLARNSRGQLGVYGDMGGGGQVVNNFNTNVTVEAGAGDEETANKTAKMIDQMLDYKVNKALSKQANQGGGLNRR